jgi:hypothetical protein
MTVVAHCRIVGQLLGSAVTIVPTRGAVTTTRGEAGDLLMIGEKTRRRLHCAGQPGRVRRNRAGPPAADPRPAACHRMTNDEQAVYNPFIINPSAPATD